MQVSPDLIPVLESHLESYPDDLEALAELERICEELGLDSGSARDRHLLRFVRSLGHSSVEAALAHWRRLTSQPERAAIAHVHLAQILALQSRLADARAELRAGARWITVASPHFRLHLIPGSTADQHRMEIQAAMEDGLADLERLFRYRFARPDPIVYYLYESSLHKRLATSDPSPAHASPREGEVHAVYGRDLRVDGLHENCHILLAALGQPPRLLEEGAAEYALHRQRVHALFLQVFPRCRGLSLARLLDDRVFAETSPWLSYPLAGSVAGFLIQGRGVAPFKAFYRNARDDCSRAAMRAYGCPVESLEAAWRRFVEIASAARIGER